MSKFVAGLDAVSRWTLVTSLAAVPLFFLPLTQDFYEMNKWLLLVGAGSILLALWAIRVGLTKTLTLVVTPGSIAFFWLVLAGLTSLLFSANKIEALLAPYGLGVFAALAIFFALGSTFLGTTGRAKLRWSIVGSAGICGLVAIYQFLGFGRTLFPNTTFLADPLWTPVGSATGLAIFLLLMLPLAGALVADSARRKSEFGLAGSVISLLLTFVGLVLTLVNLIPKLPATLFPLPAGWAILLEAFKKPPQALFGVGTENFLAAFTQGRPLTLNAGQFWNVRFVVAPSLTFQLATTLGLLGLFGLLILGRSLLWPASGEKGLALDLSLRLSLVLGLVALVLAPPNLTLLVTLTSLLILSQEAVPQSWKIPGSLAWLGSVLVILVLGGLVAVSAAVGSAWAAEVAFYRSTLALQKGSGTETYNRQIQAIRLNPRVARFHIGFSQTDLALANAIVNTAQTASVSGQLNDRDRQTVTQLVQQSITEAKIATNFAPASVVAWENLASIYESLIRVAQGADQWAIATYQQAIQLDPTNPILRLRLGGVYVGLGRLDEAANQYQAATQLKPDYANAHYNLANVYRQKQQFLPAALELSATKALVLPGSDDEKKVIAELSEIKQQLKPQERDFLDKQIAGSGAGSATGIVSPIAAPELQLSPRLNLPPEASPPATR